VKQQNTENNTAAQGTEDKNQKKSEDTEATPQE
jgi:hypothetical protein